MLNRYKRRVISSQFFIVTNTIDIRHSRNIGCFILVNHTNDLENSSLTRRFKLNDQHIHKEYFVLIATWLWLSKNTSIAWFTHFEIRSVLNLFSNLVITLSNDKCQNRCIDSAMICRYFQNTYLSEQNTWVSIPPCDLLKLF